VTADEARALFAQARVARLGTVGESGRPHLVPIAFALAGDVAFSAVDAKPKRTTALRRLENVRRNPAVVLLADHYDDGDWSALWWVRADGTGRVLAPEDPEAGLAVAMLTERYEQYRARPPHGPVLAIAVERWAGWRAT
jgi:PPOX class probable F420-dependent enzyme